MSINEEDLLTPEEVNLYFQGKFKCLERKIRKLEKQNAFYAKEVKRIKKEYDENETYFDSYPNFASEGCAFDHNSWRYKLMDEIRETKCPPNSDKPNMFEQIKLEVELEEKYKNDVGPEDEEEDIVQKIIDRNKPKEQQDEEEEVKMKKIDIKCLKQKESCEEEEEQSQSGSESDEDCEEDSEPVKGVCC